MASLNTAALENSGIEKLEPAVSGSSVINVGEDERVWSTVGGGMLLTYGLKRGSIGGLLLAAAGGYLVYRGMSGHCPMSEAIGRNTADRPAATLQPIEITTRLTIYKPREEVFQFWRQLENLPRFMSHLKEVRQLDSTHSHWVAQVGDGKVAETLGSVEWDAQIIHEVPNERLVWKSVEGATVDNAGEVRFADSADGFGTELQATIRYRPPVGHLGSAIMKLFNPAFSQLIEKDLRRFKEVIESDEKAAVPAAQALSGTAQL
ncbi:SRPBCC family protein [Larkinella sp. VNQ87]|uniref:SRPBCC family protein n=1 Tax=Larkinella sp. VNQ87 TaxID=3400921 RepID=UPI003C11C619